MHELRNYQRDAVNATLKHFRGERSPAVIVLPTGAGKSLVIAELARLAKGRVLVLAHVRELVEQNYEKFLNCSDNAGIFSAGLQRKEVSQKTIFGSIQSIARADENFFNDFSLLVIDECHRVSMDGDTQYFQVISKLRAANPAICILGLTATPYRLGFGWLYEYHQPKKMRKTDAERFFKKCVFELSLRYLIRNGFLTPPVVIDSPVACYDFSSLKLQGVRFVAEQIERLLKDQKRITPVIIQNIVDLAVERCGVMIFTSSVHHAKEILQCLPENNSALVVGDTAEENRDLIIAKFKKRELKFLVNVSVLTTGFDAPHVDVIAILRPTESVSLFQQIVGRGLRLSPGKADCLVLDYTGQGHHLFSPEIEEDKPHSDSVSVTVTCPSCGGANEFWGLVDSEGLVIEHFGRRCRGAVEIPGTRDLKDCGFRFRFKRCEKCGAENDTSARVCARCENILVDNDKKLKEAMALKDAHVLRVEDMMFQLSMDKRGFARLEVIYSDFDGNLLKEFFYFDSADARRAFHFNFVRMHNRTPEKSLEIRDAAGAVDLQSRFRKPLFVIARKQKHYWVIREKIFLS